VNMVLIAASLLLQGCALSTARASDHFAGHHLDRQRSDPPKVLAGLGVGALLKKEHVPSYAAMDWGDSVTVKDTKVFFLEAVHTSRRGTSDTNKTLWGCT
jgi:L-ascorbate metabolism protein UlaG (beta-lactamase superfamily)